MERIGIRELRQHASRHLAKVAGGATLEVTDRGRAVARLVPVTADPWADLIVAGHVTPPEDEVDIAEEAPGDYEVEASNVLAEMRSEER